MFLNKKIKEARLDKKLTQLQLAQELTNLGRKTSNTAVANWESGLNSPDVDTLQLICQVLEKDGNYFFDTENKANDFKYASYNGIDIEGLDENDIEEINRFVEFVRNKKKNKSEN